MRKLIGCCVAVAVVAFTVAGLVGASGPRRPITDLEYVTASAGDTYASIVAQHSLSCTGIQLSDANGRSTVRAGLIVFIPVSCTQPVSTTSTTVPPATSTTTSTTTTTVAPTTTTTIPSGQNQHGLPINPALIPAAVTGASGPLIGPAAHSKDRAGDNIGAFRINCARSHFNFDDPLVWPGQRDSTHLHVFAGNTGVDGFSNNASINTAGNVTCTGGTLNRSAYWAPAMIDTATGAPVYDSRYPEHFLQVYYKTGYQGVPTDTVQNFPPGLRIIAGDASASTPGSPWGPVQYSCLSNGAGGVSFPSCAAGDHLVMSVRFPQCWNGRDLDSVDHKSHMAYGVGWGNGLNGQGCPATHPVPLAEITQNYRYLVPAGGMGTWRLSSDIYTGPAGYSGHADWWNGWDFATFQRVVDNCYRGGFNCHMNLLGDGQELKE